MGKTDLAHLPAHRALEMFRHGPLSPVEHLEAMIDRAADVEPKVNALTETSMTRRWMRPKGPRRNTRPANAPAR